MFFYCFSIMPRTYKKRLGCRQYRNYTEDVLNKALTEVVENRLTLRGSAMKYNIPYLFLKLSIESFLFVFTFFVVGMEL